VRGPDGLTTTYEPVRNDHANHVLDVSVCPAPLPPHVADEARRLAREVLLGLDVVGVMCVEFFVDHEERLMVNEVAPRPHNSGHLTLEAHVCNQFEQQARAVCGLPAGSTERLVPGAAMANLMGELWSAGEPDWLASLNDPKVRLHLYGKHEARPGRKMGHLTTVAEDVETAERRIRAARESLTRGRPRTEAPARAPTATQS